MIVGVGAIALLALIAVAVLIFRVGTLQSSMKTESVAADDANERRYTLLEAIPDGVYIIDADERLTHMNEEAERLLRSEPGAFVGRAIESILDPLASDLIPEIRLARQQREIISRVVYFRATGWWVEIRIKPGAKETVIYLRDVTVRKSAEAKLVESESRLRLLMDQVPAVLWSADRLGCFASLSGAGLGALGIREYDLLGKSCASFLGAEDALTSLAAVFEGTSVEFESLRRDRWLRHQVEPLRGADGRVIGAVGVSLDITEIKDTQRRLEAMARRDALTGLPNRLALEELLAAAIMGGQQEREGTFSAVLFVDLDRFKAINDTLGHRAGDEVLRIVAERMRSSVGTRDVIARQGGDEFIIVLTSTTSPDDVGAVAARILRRFAEPIMLDGHQLFVGASIGAALSPQHGASADELIKNADAAMYRVKAAGRGTFAFYEAGMDEAAHDRLALEAEMRMAIQTDGMRLLFQPIIDVPTGRILGAEALIRWPHATRGELGPDKFIPLAEESGLIVDITKWVLRRACAFAASVRTKRADFRVSVNISARDLREANFVETVEAELAHAGLDPDGLEVEVTESVFLEDASIERLKDLRNLGVRIAVDDFGIAYNSLAYVKRLPITSLKIDKSFMQDVMADRFDQAIVKAIVTLGLTLGLHVIAEGIETEAQWYFMKELGCGQAQGFHFSRAVESTAIQAMFDVPPGFVSLSKSA